MNNEAKRQYCRYAIYDPTTDGFLGGLYDSLAEAKDDADTMEDVQIRAIPWELVLSNAQSSFFSVEIENEKHGGISPATLGSACDSLLQAPADVVIEWCGDPDEVFDQDSVRAFIDKIKDLARQLGTGQPLADLL